MHKKNKHHVLIGLNKKLRAGLVSNLVIGMIVGIGASAQADIAQIFCTVRESSRLNCQWIEKAGEHETRRKMTAGDISNFIDQAQVMAYMSVKSRAGFERVFLVDSESPSFKKMNEVKKSASISEINKAKSDLFSEIEARVVKLSDDFDAQGNSAELVKSDSSIAVDKAKLERNELLRSFDGRQTVYAEAKPGEEQAGSKMTEYDLPKKRQRVTLTYENVGYTSNFSYVGNTAVGSNLNSRSVDNVAYALAYRYSLENWIFDAEAKNYQVYSSFNKGSSGGTINFAGTDSSKSNYDVYLRANYCFAMFGNGKVCPGLDLWYDQFVVTSFKQLNTTGTNAASSSTLELQSVLDLSVVPTVLFKYPIFRGITMEDRLGYVYGTGALGANTSNKISSNTAYLLSSQVEVPLSRSANLNFGIEYLSRTASFAASGTNAAATSQNVTNTVSDLNLRLGLSWFFGGI
jgi:hypothetical protein